MKWYPEVLHFCPTTPLILVGLKADLRHNRKAIDILKAQGLTPVTSEHGRSVASKMGARYMECSSKTMEGVREIFDQAIDTVIGVEEQTVAAAKENTRSSRPSGALKRKKDRSCTIL